MRTFVFSSEENKFQLAHASRLKIESLKF